MKYHVVINGEAKGPFTAREVAELGINSETLVWHQGLENWTAASTVPEVMTAIMTVNAEKASAMPPLPQSQPAQITSQTEPQVTASVNESIEPMPSEAKPSTEQENVEESASQPAPTPQPAPAPTPTPTPQPSQQHAHHTPYYSPQQATLNNRPYNFLTMAIIAIILFFPLGIPAIIKASSVNRLWNQGQYKLAIAQSASARRLSLIAIIIGAIFQTLFFLGSL